MVAGNRVTIVVQNLPVPFDRRVWLECQALVAACYEVSVICPTGPGGESRFECLDGVRIHRYPPPPPARGTAGYVWEFAYCWARTAALARYILRTDGMDVLQACNPPDTFWALARLLRRRGVRFVFDQHDLCPEVYRSRFDQPRPAVLRGLLALERQTYRAADHVVVTNESYRDIAIERGHVRPHAVTVVRTGPDPHRLRRGAPDPALRRGRPHLVTYLGVMGPQDGVDQAVQAIHRLVQSGRTDTTFALVGDGDDRARIVELVHELGLDDYVDLPGRVSDELLFRYLSTSDLGLSPDPPNPLNEVSTMNKTMEYLAFELPVVAFDLKETMVSGADAAVYAPGGDIATYARLIGELLDDPERLRRMGARGRRRVEEVLAWDRQAPAYVAVYDRLTGRYRAPLPSTTNGTVRTRMATSVARDQLST